MFVMGHARSSWPRAKVLLRLSIWRSVSTCWVEKHSLNSPCKNCVQSPGRQVGFWLENPWGHACQRSSYSGAKIFCQPDPGTEPKASKICHNLRLHKYRPGGEIGRLRGLKIPRRKACRFESGPGHHIWKPSNHAGSNLIKANPHGLAFFLGSDQAIILRKL